MRFSRIGEHTIKCIITEEEIGDLGFTLDEIMSNGERTQEFMNHIFDLAEQEFQMKFDMGVKTVRADFMSDHTLSLTFSEHPGANGMMEHLKDIVNGLLNSVPKDKWEALQNMDGMKSIGGANEEDSEPVSVVVQFIFSDLDIICRFAKLVNMEKMPWNALYRYKNRYHLIMDLSDCSEMEVKRLSSLTDEYAEDIWVGPDKRAFITEHAKPILTGLAIEQLRQL
jgi:adapter protein MecA 1/2